MYGRGPCPGVGGVRIPASWTVPSGGVHHAEAPVLRRSSRHEPAFLVSPAASAPRTRRAANIQRTRQTPVPPGTRSPHTPLEFGTLHQPQAHARTAHPPHVNRLHSFDPLTSRPGRVLSAPPVHTGAGMRRLVATLYASSADLRGSGRSAVMTRRSVGAREDGTAKLSGIYDVGPGGQVGQHHGSSGAGGR